MFCYKTCLFANVLTIGCIVLEFLKEKILKLGCLLVAQMSMCLMKAIFSVFSNFDLGDM